MRELGAEVIDEGDMGAGKLRDSAVGKIDLLGGSPSLTLVHVLVTASRSALSVKGMAFSMLERHVAPVKVMSFRPRTSSHVDCQERGREIQTYNNHPRVSLSHRWSSEIGEP